MIECRIIIAVFGSFHVGISLICGLLSVVGQRSRWRRLDKCFALIAPFSIQMVGPLLASLEFKKAVQFWDENCKKIRAEIDEVVLENVVFFV